MSLRRTPDADHPRVRPTAALLLPPLSADVLDDDLIDAPDPPIDEAAIKETPPRPSHCHNRSEPRTLSEVIDEAEWPSSPASPTLRHPKGRLEEKASRESNASVFKPPFPSPVREREHSSVPVKEHFCPLPIKERSPLPVKEQSPLPVKQHPPLPVKEQSPWSVKHPSPYCVEPPSPLSVKENWPLSGNDYGLLPSPSHHRAHEHGNGVPSNPPASDNYTFTAASPHQINTFTKANVTFDGLGEDEALKSPTRRAHKRAPSRSLNRDMSKKVKSDRAGGADGTHAKKLGVGDVLYNVVRNKSGENLASIKMPEQLNMSQQRQQQDKPHSTDPSRKLQRRDSELTSGRRAGEGWGRSAISWAPLNLPLQRRLQTVMVLIHTLSIVGGLAIFLFLCAIPLLWPILLPYLIYVLLSRASIDGRLSQRSEWFRSSKIWSLFASYYPARLHRSQTLEPTRKYIFGYHPHGIISHGAFAAFATEALGFKQLFPGITNTLLTLDSNFRIPLYRDYALRMGLASVSRESCENILSKGGPNGEGMGRAITIVVGGARESLDAKPHTLRLVLKRRKGFVKLAIRTGADLVPVLSFGENDLYDQFDSEGHPWIHKGQMLVKKFMGFTVPLFHARGVFNYDVGMMPYRRPINVVVGRPIRIVQNKNPDPASVDEIHSQYVNELVRIWEDWKDTFARDRKGELEIVE